MKRRRSSSGTFEPVCEDSVAGLKSMTQVAPRGCWEWQGNTQNGYGRFGRYGYAHRRMYELVVGPIPAGCEIDHLCMEKSCINPAHLEAVPHRVNVARFNRARAAKITHCPQGHPYDQANTYISHRGNGSPFRTCRSCVRARSKQRRVVA